MSLGQLEVDAHIIIRNKESAHHASAFGRGIARLCEGVERTGSLNQACKDMGMAYSKGWQIMRSTEESLGVQLLERHGAHGSVLTQEAKVILRAFRQTEKELSQVGQAILEDALADSSSH